MVTPEFVLALREKIGHAPLPVVGVTAVIVRDDKVLLGTRADNGRVAPVAGIVDPGEEPADAAVREALEEAGVVIHVRRLAWVHQIPRITYANGDEVDCLDLTFLCDWVAGDPYPADGELTDVGWYGIEDLSAVSHPDHRQRIAYALLDKGAAAFRGGR